MRKLPAGMLAVSLAALCGTLVFNTFPLFVGFAADHFELGDTAVGALGSSYMASYALITFSSLIWLRKVPWRPAAGAGIVLSLLILAALARVPAGVMLFAAVVLLAAASSIPQLIANAWIDTTKHPDPLFGVKAVFDQSAAALAVLALTALFITAAWSELLIVYAAVFLVSLGAALRIPARRQQAAVQTVRGSPRGWIALGILAIHSVAMVGFWSFAERIGNDLDAPTKFITTVMSGAMLAGIFGAACSSMLVNRIGLTRSIMLLYLAVCLAPLFFLAGDSLWFYAFAVLFFQFTWISLNVLQIAFVADADSHGGLVAIVSVGMTAGGAFGPVTAGFMRGTLGNEALYAMVIILTTLCAWLTWRIGGAVNRA